MLKTDKGKGIASPSSAWRDSARAVRLALVVALGLARVSASLCAVPSAGLAERIARLVEAYGARGARVGVSVRAIPSGRQVVHLQADRKFIPASCQKIFTSAVAMERLGGRFEFVTSLYRAGRDIVVVGDFDPTLGDPRIAARTGRSIYDQLDRWAQAVRDDGRTRRLERLLLVSNRPVSSYRHPDWPTGQYRRWYCTPVAELNFHDNCLDVSFIVKNGQALPDVSPQSRWIRIVSRVKVGAKHLWSIQMGAAMSVVTLSGTVRRTTVDALSVAVDDPVMLLGRVFADRLARVGVSVGRVESVAEDQVDLAAARLLYRTRTPIKEALIRACKRSLNLAAECMFVRSGDGTWSGSAKIAAETLAERFGLERGSFRVRDGSGLSRQNLSTPAGLTRVLVAAAARPYGGTLLDALAVSGTDGTLERRLGSERYRGRIRAKTGSLAGVSTLAGYVLDTGQNPALAFAILINRVPAGGLGKAKALQDAICRAMVDHIWPGGARR